MFRIMLGRLLMVRGLLLAASFSLVSIGFITIYAAGNPAEPIEGLKLTVPAALWKKQLFFAVAGLLAIIVVNLFSYRILGPASYWLYPGILLVLVTLLLDRYEVIDIPFVPMINNTHRWIRLGTKSHYIQIQPSELCKIVYILALAWYLRFRKNYRHASGLVVPFALTLLAMVLILLEPNLGTVMLMMPILFAMLYVAGAKTKHLILILLSAAAVAPFLWHKMLPYQRMRISAVLLQNQWIYQKAQEHPGLATVLAGSPQDLAKWTEKEGYQLMHSKIAIASGGIWGYGFRKGPYLQENTLPERQNDFIFPIIAHQFGLVGCLVVLMLYAVIIVCGVEIAWQNTDPFARLVTVGILTMFSVEVVVNISMTLGLMPITGLTLPLVSYGGSSLVVSMMAIGLLNNIGRSRAYSVANRPFEYSTEE
ncbi:MAG: rod shape-determining protein RodA [Phycisphaerae bacterium]|nr:rod shape-determining protein RodA [Phycisphaerae bacterium]